MGQSLANILLHIIFSTKNRSPLIDEHIEPKLFGYIVPILANHGSFVHKIGGMPDHIHILCSLPRTNSPSDLLEVIKGKSSKWIKSQGEKYQHFYWQNGYGVFSVSASNRKIVGRYIEQQKKHHKKYSFQEEFRKMLVLNEIPYDERYVWD